MEIRFLGHACFELTDGDTRVLIDPFLTGNPKAAAEASELEPTHIFLTHGHSDHYGDIVDIAKRTNAQVVAIVELAGELGEQGLENVSDPNLGGTVEFDGGLWVRLVPAWHTSTTPNGTVNTPAGMVIGIGGKVVYHLGDTCLFSDLQLVGQRTRWTWPWCCIGGHYTMDREEAAVAAELVGAGTVIPLPLRHVPADRDRRSGVQGGRGEADRREDHRGGAGSGRDCLRSREERRGRWPGEPAPRRNHTGRSFQSCAIRTVSEHGEQDARGPVMDPLSRYPDPAAGEVQTDHPITVCHGRDMAHLQGNTDYPAVRRMVRGGSRGRRSGRRGVRWG